MQTAAHSGWFSYDSYEDCMLGRMKGQSERMYYTADKACKKEFRVEFDILKSSVNWEFEGNQISVTSDGDPEYEISSGEFVFSSKSWDCAALTKEDFGMPVQLRFIAGKARIPSDTKCGRALSFKARYK
jgi:hypothetical protein